MKTTYDKDIVQQYIKSYKIHEHFETLPDDFYIRRYENGELITNPTSKMDEFYFVLKGDIHIYSIRSDGSMYTLTMNDTLTFLGDIEYINDETSNYFVEAKSDVIILCLKADPKYKQDNLFLQFLLTSLGNKLIQASRFQADYSDLKDKLISYMKYGCQNHVLTHVEKTAMKLHCSKRQLQRLLSELVKENKIMKIKKGMYQLL